MTFKNDSIPSAENIINFPSPRTEKEKFEELKSRYQSNKERDDKLFAKMQQAAYKLKSPAFTATWFANTVEDAGIAGKAGNSYLRRIAKLLRSDHWRYVTRSGMSKPGIISTATVSRGQKQLQDAGLIYVAQRYGPTKRISGKPRPSKKPPLVWLYGLTIRALLEIDGVDYLDVPPMDLYEAITDKERKILGHKIPRKDDFICIKK